MGTFALFAGFLIGAAIGTIATATTAARLHDEALQWIRKSEWRVFARTLRRKPIRLLPAVLNLLQIEILLLLLGVWIAGLIWTTLFTPSWDNQSYGRYIIGSVVGTAAAPWIWLHFSRELASDTQKPDGGDDNQLSRYRFMTFMFGAAILMAILQPYLSSWLPRANKIEGFGVALNLSQPRNDRGTSIPLASQSANFGDTTSRLSSATSRAYLVTSGERSKIKGLASGKKKTLQDVGVDLEGFGELSVVDRDKVYIAYFFHEMNAQHGAPVPDVKNLSEYISVAKFDTQADEEFLKQLAPLSECISLYAENLRDFRLFLVDSGSFLRALLVDVASQWSLKNSERAPTDSSTLNLEGAREFSEQVVKALRKSKLTPEGACQDASALVPAGFSVKGIGETPYPAYFIAHYLAAIDSVESGVVVLRDWLYFQRKQQEKASTLRNVQQEWYTVRAMLTSSQLPYRFGNLTPTHRASVKFQQETTDRFASLLGIQDARSWRSLCKRLDQRGLHAQIGRYLALTYADERNYLFELLLPEDFGLPSPSEKALLSTEISPSTYVEESEAILESSECFTAVPRFNRKLIGQYALNLAQLRYSVRMTVSDGEKPALTRKIRADLEKAKQLEDTGGVSDAFDLLRQTDEFEPHRTRLARLRKSLDSEDEKE